MFRLNGDIVKQLENIYNIKFHSKYKNELKDRLLSFVNTFISNLEEPDFLIKLSIIKTYIIIDKNSISTLSSSFIDTHKIEILNSFNPLWYVSKEPKQKLTILEKEQMFNQFILHYASLSIKNILNKFNKIDILNNSTNDFNDRSILRYRVFNEDYYLKLFNGYLFPIKKTNNIFKFNKSILSKILIKHSFFQDLNEDIEDFGTFNYSNIIFSLNNKNIPLLNIDSSIEDIYAIYSGNYQCYQLEDFICSLILKEFLFNLNSFLNT